MPGPGELRLLGPVEAVGPAGTAALHGARQRAVLGVLALHAGSVLPISRLIEVLWGEDPPRTAVKTLHSHVARIRQALTACGFPPLLRTREPGYLLTADAVVDVHRFEHRVRAARKDLVAGAADAAVVGLRAALGLWRGEAFADADLRGWGRREVDRLHELRQAASEDLWDAELRRGNHEDAVRELPRLLADKPARERLVGLHMLALYRAGRHTDALCAFQVLRERLAEDLGVDPGPELLAMHTAILRRDPELDLPRPSGGPAQLPARVGYFTGRDAELAAMDAMLEQREERPVVVISGAAGMGKTALALQWAHRVAHRFPDGQLFLDQRGHDPTTALPAADALAHLLRGLDVPDERIPAELTERAALYRSLLRGRRCLVLLDNAAAVPEVLPLVPGAGASLLVVTSRPALAGVGTRHEILPVALDAMRHRDSMALLGRVLGTERIGAEPGPAARLTRLCGGLPLALRIAAARLAGEPHRRIATLASELLGAGRLDTLAVEGDARTVRTVLASAYHPLDALPAMIFRRFGLSPGPTVSAALGAALCGIDTARAAATAGSLVAVQLLTEVREDRFRFHDLTREFARSCAQAEPDGGRAEAQDRLIDWYLHVVAAANRVIDPNRDLVTPHLREALTEVPFAPDRHAAQAFLAAERDNLLPVVKHAREHGRLAAAWQLTYLLTSFYDATGHWHERVELCKQGAAAAEKLGDPQAEAEMLRALGAAYFRTRRLAEALRTNELALGAVRAAGDVGGEGHVYNNIGNALVELRRFDEAMAAHQLAVRRCAAAGNRLGHALSLRNLGYTYVRMSRPAESLEPLAGALATFRELGNGRLEAATLDTLGVAHLRRGDYRAALATFAEALAVSQAIGDRWLEWECLLDTGKAHLQRADHGAALDHFTRALEISRDVGDRHGEAAARRHLGRAQLEANDLAGARDTLESAMVLRASVPDGYEQANLHRELGELEARCGRPQAAAGHWRRAIALYRDANAADEAQRLASRVT